jgi:Tfp pilus assembly protein PilN
MSKKKVTFTINLLPKDPFFSTALGKALRWALSVGRYIVIFTELVVIISFASRFSLDRQVTDLNDSLNQKQTIIESYGDLEKDIRTTQMRIEQIQQIEQSDTLLDVFPKLSAITPRDITLTELTIRPAQVDMQGTAYTQNSLNNLINNLQLTPEFTQVSVEKIETNTEKSGGFSFRITMQTKAVAPPSAPKKAGN